MRDWQLFKTVLILPYIVCGVIVFSVWYLVSSYEDFVSFSNDIIIPILDSVPSSVKIIFSLLIYLIILARL